MLRISTSACESRTMDGTPAIAAKNKTPTQCFSYEIPETIYCSLFVVVICSIFFFHHILRWLCYTIYREKLRHFSDEINVVYTDTQTFVLTYTHTVDTHIVSGPCTCYHFYISSVYVENVWQETCVAPLGWKADYTLVMECHS